MAGNWSPERIFLEYFEAEMTEIGRIPKAQMKLRILIKKPGVFEKANSRKMNEYRICFRVVFLLCYVYQITAGTQ